MRTYRIEKEASFGFMLSSFALVIPFPGRLAYGILLVILLNVQMLSISFFRRLVELLHLDDLLSVLTAAMLLCESIIFKQLLALYSPLMALTLSFAIYLPAVSSFVISRLRPADSGVDSRGEVKDKLGQSLTFSALALVFFLVRDVLGYGTLTLPGRKGLLCLNILSQSENAHTGVFLASIPGAILLVTISFILFWQIRRKLDSLGGASDDSVA